MANVKKPGQKEPEKNSSVLRYTLIFTVILIIAYILYAWFIKKNEGPEYRVKIDPMEQYKDIKEPQFKSEGSLDILDSTGKNVMKHLDIEIADNPPERQQGLMYRRSMSDDRGMLFIFQAEEAQEFWMKNTLIPLDIIYISKDKKVGKIYKNTTPLSEKGLSSEKPAMYVLEVRGGWSDQYNLKPGDKIDFKYN